MSDDDQDAGSSSKRQRPSDQPEQGVTPVAGERSTIRHVHWNLERDGAAGARFAADLNVAAGARAADVPPLVQGGTPTVFCVRIPDKVHQDRLELVSQGAELWHTNLQLKYSNVLLKEHGNQANIQRVISHEQLMVSQNANKKQSQMKTATQRTQWMTVFRDNALTAHDPTRCRLCVADNLRLYLASKDKPIYPAQPPSDEEREALIAGFENSPDNTVNHHPPDMMTKCSKNCYICCICAGDLLSKEVTPESREVRCRVPGCSGVFQTSGDGSLADQAYTEQERQQLARYQTYEKPDQVLVANDPMYDHRWKLYHHIENAFCGGIWCPSCDTPATMPELCGHIECLKCGKHFCGWCGAQPREPDANGDPIRLKLTNSRAYHSDVICEHKDMCHSMFWIMNFCHADENGDPKSVYSKLVTPFALARNAHGRQGLEHGMPVAGDLPDRSDVTVVFDHFRVSLPNDWVLEEGKATPDFDMPVSAKSPGFSRMWGDANYHSPSYAQNMYWRRKEDIEVQQIDYLRKGIRIIAEQCVLHGYHVHDYHYQSFSATHFEKFCKLLELWVQLNIQLYYSPLNCYKIEIERLQEVFAFAAQARHHFECQVPYLVLLAMRKHQLREGAHYQNGRVEDLPDARFKPFADTYRLSQAHRTYPTIQLGPYFPTVDGVVSRELRRKPWEGFPFVHPDKISISDRTQAGVVYNVVLAQRPEHHNWEHSIEFHRNFHKLMDQYAETTPAGPRPGLPSLERGLNN